MAGKKVLPTHMQDICSCEPPPSYVSPVVIRPYFLYLKYFIQNILLAIVFDFPTLIMHPIITLVNLVTYVLLSIGLFILGVTLKVSFFFGAGDQANKASVEYGDGLSVLNWWNTDLFNEPVYPLVNRAKLLLSSHDNVTVDLYNRTVIEDVHKPAPSRFNLDLAEFLCLVSGIIYERDLNYVFQARHKLAEHGLKNPYPSYGSIVKTDLSEIENLILQSDKRIHEQANRWGLKFFSLSELNAFGRAYAGLFYSPDHDFIILAFKGSTPFDFDEWVTDCSFRRVDAPYLFGRVHEGWYECLFSNKVKGSSKAGIKSPYQRILEGIDIVVKELMRKNTKINLWVTGHSLGASLGTLFFARAMKDPVELPEGIMLRDAYFYGTPYIGDSTFVSSFSGLTNTPVTRQNTIWRVVDDKDVLARLITGNDDPTFLQYASRDSFLNYGHVGEEIMFYQDGRLPKSPAILFPELLKMSSKEMAHAMKDAKNNKRSVNGANDANGVDGANGVNDGNVDVRAANGSTGDDMKAMNDVSDLGSTSMSGMDNDFGSEKLARALNPDNDYGNFPKGSHFYRVQFLTPTRLKDHYIHRYVRAMERSRKYFKMYDSNYSTGRTK
ncbi:9863_t:CDS:2 [Paraglomus occultum]|uniref:9863_t:CDS:1 n=1 Tax=Paraglomus occultum TaxID=144539 RepID=A0A9N9GKA4_9GLOM|nr:9863_t:CDS:2 [Paraglomus occultum]